MRLWSLHPGYLDSKGLVALWREALLAQKVLLGQTRGYKFHPQLKRFKAVVDPPSAIGLYLKYVCDEADVRHYHFDRSKIKSSNFIGTLTVTRGQLLHEQQHLVSKLVLRNPPLAEQLENQEKIEVHPLFSVIPGPVEEWEKTSP